jgi:hypothetical protein
MGVPEKESYIWDYDGHMIWDDMGYFRKYDGTYRKILYIYNVGIVWEHDGIFWGNNQDRTYCHLWQLEWEI